MRVVATRVLDERPSPSAPACAPRDRDRERFNAELAELLADLLIADYRRDPTPTARPAAGSDRKRREPAPHGHRKAWIREQLRAGGFDGV